MAIAEQLTQALAALTQAEPKRRNVPPGYLIATGFDDRVMLFLVRIGGLAETVNVISSVITLSESATVVDSLGRTGGLIRKLLPVAVALQLRDSLAAAGTVAQIVRPDDS